MKPSKITQQYREMRPFRQWARSMQYLSAGYFACLNNAMVPLFGGEYKYNVYL